MSDIGEPLSDGMTEVILDIDSTMVSPVVYFGEMTE